MKYDLIVSLVLYNPNQAHLQQTLASLDATPLKIKIAIADNSPAPVDMTQFRSRHPLEYFYCQKNLGFGRAHNCNIKKYVDEAPYFLILNPDVYFDASLLPELCQRMQTDRDIGLSIPRICHPGGDLQLVNRRLPRPQDYALNFLNGRFKLGLCPSKTYERYLLRDMNLEKPLICPTISGCFMLFRKDALKKAGGFDERYFLYLEDTDLSRRVAVDFKTVVFSDLIAHHHWTRGAYKNIKLFSLFLKNMVVYFNKWGWFFDRQRDQLNRKVQYYS